jgi:hypothetical protein
MVQSKGLSLRYWEESINCDTYIVNNTPTKELKYITPEETWTKIEPVVRDLYVFGSEAYAHIPDEKMKELQPKSEKCTFVGYFEDVKVYRLLKPHSNEISIRRYVKFDENLSTCEPNLAFIPFLVYVSSSLPKFFVSDLIMVYSSYDESGDENTPPPTHLPPDDSIEHELALAPLLP